MYHFFGYDGYIADCEVAIRLLEQLKEHVVSFRCDARDQLDLYNVYESTREPVSYTHLTLPTICSV